MRRAPAPTPARPREARGFVAPLVAVAALGVLGVLTAAVLDDRERAFTVGLPAARAAAAVLPGGDACRGGIDVPAGFSRVRFTTASFGRPGPPLTVTSGTSRARVAGGYPDNSTVEVRLDNVGQGERISVCVANDGNHPVAVLGSPPDTPAYQLTYPPLEAAMGFEFVRDEPRSMASLVPDAFERASRFRPAWVGPWTFWILLGFIAVALPALLVAAYRSAVTDSNRT